MSADITEQILELLRAGGPAAFWLAVLYLVRPLLVGFGFALVIIPTATVVVRAIERASTRECTNWHCVRKVPNVCEGCRKKAESDG